MNQNATNSKIIMKINNVIPTRLRLAQKQLNPINLLLVGQLTRLPFYSGYATAGSTSVGLFTCNKTNNANPVNLSSAVLLRRNVFRRFSAENDLSAVALDTGIVPNRRKRVATAGNKLSFSRRMTSRMSIGRISCGIPGIDCMRLIHVLTCASTSMQKGTVKVELEQPRSLHYPRQQGRSHSWLLA